jgi:hypothetical protein
LSPPLRDGTIYNISLVIATWNNVASSRYGVAWVVM